MDLSSLLRSSTLSLPACTWPLSRILMLTSWSEVSTPAELSMKSVLISTPLCAASMRPHWVKPRLPPSPPPLHRSSPPLMRIALLARSPTSALASPLPLTYVPMPPFHSSYTGALSPALISSLELIAATSSPRPTASRISADTGIDLAQRATPPPPFLTRSEQRRDGKESYI